jgi:hypothetical protein
MFAIGDLIERCLDVGLDLANQRKNASIVIVLMVCVALNRIPFVFLNCYVCTLKLTVMSDCFLKEF